MRNFSTKVDLPHIPENPEYSDLTESLTVLHIFAKEFFDSITREFVEAAKEFCETLNDFAPWSSREVHILAFWFSNVFAAYRLAVVNDLRTGSVSRFKIQLKFSMQDAELTGLLFKASRGHARQAASSRADPAHRALARTHPGDGSTNAQPGNQQRRRDKKVPAEVSAQVP
ncbi:hypothetical protein PF006_g33570, partial [Phytophthora fragariae]